MSKKIKLSIIVIGYNVEKYIQKCLESLLPQLKEEVELIFVNDGSKDNTATIVNKLFECNSNCTYYYKENGGANSARIYGFQKALGEYISFVDGDDELEEDYVDEILKELSTSQDDVITFNYYNKDLNGNKSENELYEENIYKEYEFLDNIITAKIPHYLWNKVYKKELLNKVEFEKVPKITMGDDLIANIKIGLEKPNTKAIRKVLYSYYINTNSVSRKANPKFIEMITVLKEMENLMKERKLYDEYKEKINFQYFRTFFFYVVRNRYKTTDVQKKIYQEYKKRKIKIQKNKHIKDWINKRSLLERMLVKIYFLNYYMGYVISRLYVTYDKLRRN